MDRQHLDQVDLDVEYLILFDNPSPFAQTYDFI